MIIIFILCIFPLTLGKCFEGEIYPVNQLEQWNGYSCYDLKGNEYKPVQTILSCCGCVKLTCTASQVPSNSYGMWTTFWKESKEATCCKDCHGKVFPIGSVISSQLLKDKCSTTVTKHCVFQSRGNDSFARISENYKSKSCCYDSSGVHPLGRAILDPKTCSSRQCSLPQGSLYGAWISSSKKCPGLGCDCCVHGGELVCDGGHITLPNGVNATCCRGMLMKPQNPDEDISRATAATTITTTTTTSTTTTATYGSATTIPGDVCPAGWTSMSTGCYRFFQTASTFDQAKTNCKKEGGFVAEVDTQTKLNALSKFYKDSGISANVWLGASDVTKEGEWIWIHSGKKMTFNRWGSGEPNNDRGNEDCAHWSVGNGVIYWNDTPCSSIFYTLCEYEDISRATAATTITTTTTTSPTTTATYGSVTTIPGGCSAGTEFMGNCYELVETSSEWDVAAQDCSSRGGALASIFNEKVNTFLARLAGTRTWIGGSDRGKEGVWVWPNGDEIIYTNWSGSEPNDTGGDEDCMEINYANSPSGKWNDMSCSNKFRYICQFSMAILE